MKLRYLPIFLAAAVIPITSVLAVDSSSSSLARREKITQRIESIKENAATREAALKAKLQTFKDKKKAATVERVNTTLAMINKKQTDQMLKHLDKMSELLSRLETRVSSQSGKDTTQATKAIADAKTSISTARTAVQAQQAKDYTITATSEVKVKDDAKKERDLLHTDLSSTRGLVIKAKQAVANAIQVAATTLEGENNGK